MANCVPKPPSPEVLTNILSLVSSPSYSARTKIEDVKIKIWICVCLFFFFLSEETWKESKAENEESRTIRGLCSPVEFCVSVSGKMCVCHHQAANRGASGALPSGKKKKSVQPGALPLIASYCLFCWKIVFYLNPWCVNTLNGLHRTVEFVLSCVTDDGQCLPFVPFVLTATWWIWVLGHVANVKRSLKLVKILKCWLFM